MRWWLLLAGILIAVALAPLLVPHDPAQTDSMAGLQPPSAEHLLGTDRLGRDVFSRLLYGGQRTLGIAVLATSVAVGFGLLIGLTAAVAGDAVDAILTAILDALLAFPGLLLALVVVTLLGTSAQSVALATGTALIAQYGRVTRSAVIAVRGIAYIEAAQALGASQMRILIFHILPNITPTLLAFAGVTFSYSLLNSAALNFLGLGGDLGAADWGTMLFEGRVMFRAAPWISIMPGLAISSVVYAVNRLTDRILSS